MIQSLLYQFSKYDQDIHKNHYSTYPKVYRWKKSPPPPAPPQKKKKKKKRKEKIFQNIFSSSGDIQSLWIAKGLF